MACYTGFTRTNGRFIHIENFLHPGGDFITVAFYQVRRSSVSQSAPNASTGAVITLMGNRTLKIKTIIMAGVMLSVKKRIHWLSAVSYQPSADPMDDISGVNYWREEEEKNMDRLINAYRLPPEKYTIQYGEMKIRTVFAKDEVFCLPPVFRQFLANAFLENPSSRMLSAAYYKKDFHSYQQY